MRIHGSCDDRSFKVKNNNYGLSLVLWALLTCNTSNYLGYLLTFVRESVISLIPYFVG